MAPLVRVTVHALTSWRRYGRREHGAVPVSVLVLALVLVLVRGLGLAPVQTMPACHMKAQVPVKQVAAPCFHLATRPRVLKSNPHQSLVCVRRCLLTCHATF